MANKIFSFNAHGDLALKEAPGGKSSSGGAQITNSNLKNFMVKAVGFQGESDSADFNPPNHDLQQIKNAADTDSYINIAIQKYSQLIFKAGYNIVSDNDDAAAYLRSRLRMMGFATNTPMDITFQEVARDLVEYGNAFLIKSRGEASQLGGIQAQGILDSKPVVGYFHVDPTTIQIKRDKNGTIKQYQQESGNNKKSFKPTDVVHFFSDREGGDAFGTPRLSAALEDVKLLRKIEGNVLDLIYRFAIPLYQMKVGIPQQGMMATDQEISDAQTEIEKMASDGIIVTNERTEFNAIGAEGQALDASGYLKYFESRVFSALNLSQAMMGRGGAKQDADSMEEQVHDTVKFFQRIFSIFVESAIFNELLLEGGFNPISEEYDIVKFQFNEISLDTKVKMENHYLNQFQGGALTFEEMRQETGKDSDSVDESRLYPFMVQQKNALELVQAKMGGSSAEPGAAGDSAKKSGDSPGPDAKAKNPGGNSAKSVAQPTNQHGTTSAHIKESYQNKHNSTAKNIELYKKNFASVYKKYTTLRNETIERNANFDTIFALTRDSISKDLQVRIEDDIAKGVDKASKDAKRGIVSKKIPTTLLNDKIKTTVTNILDDIQKRLKHAESSDDKRAAFDAVEYRLRFLAENVTSKAYWFGYVKACEQLGIETVYVDYGDSSDKENHDAIINTKAFSLDDIPAYHAYCTCKVGLHKERR